jgi:hypothetical protein
MGVITSLAIEAEELHMHQILYKLPNLEEILQIH